MSRRPAGGFVAVLFLTSTATFMAGSSLIGRYFSGDGSVGELLAGVALEAYTAVAVLGIGVVIRPVLRERTPGLATTYLGLRAAECAAILAVGGWFVLTRSPWSQYELLVYAATGSAGLVLSRALLRGRLVPRALAVLGVIGYAALLAGGVLDAADVLALGSTAGSAFYVPGAVFEIALPVWLLLRGFAQPGTQTASSTTGPATSAVLAV